MHDDDQLPLDNRMVQANERTLLAWIRTSIALMTLGFVIERLGPWLNAVDPQPGRKPAGTAAVALGICFIILAVLVNLLALHRYRRVLAALRTGKAMSPDSLPVVFAGLVVVLSAIVLVFTLLGMG